MCSRFGRIYEYPTRYPKKQVTENISAKKEGGAEVLSSVRTLLEGAIDYAGLFPPSQLSMSEAVLNFAMYKNSNYSWMLGRFVLAAAQLPEFLESSRDFISRAQDSSWRLSVLAGEDIYDTVRRIREFNAENGPGVLIDSLEAKAATVSKIENTVQALPEGITTYFEISNNENFVELISTLAFRGQRAKIRTGGVTPDAFPRPADVIRFVRACTAANVPFKATAGLHHPLRCFKPLTYEPEAPMGTMHGFLNLFLMTGFARESYKPALLEDLMEEEFEEAFEFGEKGVTWRGEYSLNLWQIERLRQLGVNSFGSCSFEEPIADLQELGLL